MLCVFLTRHTNNTVIVSVYKKNGLKECSVQCKNIVLTLSCTLHVNAV